MDKHKTKIKSYSTFRIVVLTFLVTALFAVAAWYFFIFEKQIRIVPLIEMAEVKIGDLKVELISEGELIPVKSEPVMVPESFFNDFSIQEIAYKVLLPEYGKVDKGDVIAQLDPSVSEKFKSDFESEIVDLKNKIREIAQDSVKQLKDVKLALENARIDLEIRKIAVEQSLFDPASAHERMKLEFSKSSLAFENALTNYNERRKSVLEIYESYPNQIEKLKADGKSKLPMLREALRVKSPLKGILIYATGSQGQNLTPANRLVAIVDDISRLVSKFYVGEEYYSDIHEGQEIDIYLKSNAVEIRTKITRVDRKIVTIGGRKVFLIEAIIDNQGYNLLPGQTTVNKIALNPLRDVLYLPNSSVHEEGEWSYVFLNGGIRHEVKSKKVNEEFTQIIRGLSAGQMVYLNAAAAISK